MAEAFKRGNRLAAEQEAAAGVEKIHRLFPESTPADVSAILKRLDEYITAFQQLQEIEDN